MADRQSLHRRFVDAFHVGDAATPATDAQLDATNAACGITLPASFRAFATSVGDAYTPTILDAITDRNLGHPDVQNFMPVTDIPDETASYWQAGMPDTVVAFASDCMGNLFVFARELRALAPDDAPVLYFDHDFATVETVADSFDAFLSWFLDKYPAVTAALRAGNMVFTLGLRRNAALWQRSLGLVQFFVVQASFASFRAVS